MKTATFRRRRCRACRYQWDSAVGVKRVRCPRCQADQFKVKRKGKTCRWCGYVWLTASVYDNVRCPSCNRTAEPKYPEAEVRTCPNPKCGYEWRARAEAHVRRPRCPACFTNLNSARWKKTK